MIALFSAALISLLALGWARADQASAAGTCSLGGVKTWIASSPDANWFNGNNWSPKGVPTAGTNVCIQNVPPGGTVKIETGATARAASIESSVPIRLSSGVLSLESKTQQSDFHSTFNLSGGELTGNGSMNLDGTLTWDGTGAMSGTGTTTIAAAGTLAFSGSENQTHEIDRHLVLNGTATWSGKNSICVRETSFDIGGTLTISPAAGFSIFNCGGEGTLHVLSGGTLTKGAVAPATEIGALIDNDGTVSASSGSLTFPGGSGSASSSGTWSTAAGKTIELTGGVFNASGTTIGGAGTFRVAGGSLNLAGTNKVQAGATLGLRNSSTIGGEGNLEVNGALAWDGTGTMSGTGTTTIAAAGTLAFGGSESQTHEINRHLVLSGSGSWSGKNLICVREASFDIGGTFSIAPAAGFSMSNCGEGLLHVLSGGTLTKTGGGATTEIGALIDNDGTVSASLGALQFSGGSGSASSSGTWSTTAGKAIELTSGVFNASGTTVGGAGTFRLAGGSLNNLVGTNQVQAGATLRLSGGTIEGEGDLEVNGTLAWDGNGEMSGTGTTTIAAAGTLAFSGSESQQHVIRRHLVLSGTGTWTGSNSVFLCEGASFDIGGTFSISPDSGFTLGNCGGEPLLHVLAGGTLTKTGGGETTEISAPLDNDGTVSASSGALQFSGGSGSASSSGTWSTTAGNSVELTSGVFNASGTTVGGAGTFRVAGGSLNLSGTNQTQAGSTLGLRNSGTIGGEGNLEVNGALAWDGNGEMSGTGTTTIAAAGTLAFSGGESQSDVIRRHLVLNGSGTWTGSNSIFLCEGASFDIGGTLSASPELGFSVGNCGGEPLLHVLVGGTLTKTGGGATTEISAPLDNDGTVSSGAGTLQFSGGSGSASSSGTWAPAAGQAVELTGGTFNASGTTIGGAGAFRVAGGILNLAGTNKVQAGATLGLRNSSTIGGEGNLEVNGALAWDGNGEMSGTGTTTIAAAGTLAFSGSEGESHIISRHLVLNGSGTWSGSNSIFICNGAALDVAGTFSVSPDSSFSVVGCGSPVGLLHVLAGGVLTKAGGGETTEITTKVTNDGTIRSSSGILYTPTLTNYNPVNFKLTGGQYEMLEGKLEVPGEIKTNAATLTLSGFESELINANTSGDALQNLATNAAGSKLEVLNGRDKEVPTFSNSGEIVLGANDTLVTTKYTQNAAGTLTPTVTGTTPGATAGHLVSLGAVSLNGTLHVVAPSPPGPSDSVDVINSEGALKGTFATVVGSGYTPDYDTNRVRLFASTPPTISLSDGAAVEGNSGTTSMNFTISLSGPSSVPVTLKYKTADLTATAPDDYTAIPLTALTFAPGETSKVVSVTIKGDTIREGEDSFNVIGQSPVNASFADSTAKGRILDDDGVFSAYVGDVTLVEGNAGDTNASFPVSLSEAPAPGQAVKVNYTTVNGTASSASDYQATAGTLEFTSGTGATQNVLVPVHGDLTQESNEAFKLKISPNPEPPPPPGPVIADAQGTATIRNDDVKAGPAVKPSLYISNSFLLEGDAGTAPMAFTINLSEASAIPVTVTYQTTPGTAAATNDYVTVAPTTITFEPGQTSKVVNVDVQGDTVHELKEEFTVQLSSPTNAVIGDASAKGTILDNEGPLSMSISDVQVGEGTGGGHSAVFTVKLSGTPAPGQSVLAEYQTADITATAGSDYTASTGTVTFNNSTGDTRTISVPISGDSTVEPNETFEVDLTQPQRGVIADSKGIGTIRNDD